eukprot:5438343-Amphidinium_carterae.1
MLQNVCKDDLNTSTVVTNEHIERRAHVPCNAVRINSRVDLVNLVHTELPQKVEVFRVLLEIVESYNRAAERLEPQLQRSTPKKWGARVIIQSRTWRSIRN